MTQNIFDQMSRDELKTYALNNRSSGEAVHALLNRRVPGERYPLPKTEGDVQMMKDIFEKKIFGN